MGLLGRLVRSKNSNNKAADSTTPESPEDFKTPKTVTTFKSQKSWKSTKSTQSPTSPTSPWLKTRQNLDGLDQCEGCSNVALLTRRNVEALQSQRPDRIATGMLHSSFAELDECARKCHICRVFRQALIIQEVTFDGVERLLDTPGEVTVRWGEQTVPEGPPTLFLHVEIKGQPEINGIVSCASRNEVGHLALHANGLEPAVVEQAKGWLQTCLSSHIGACENLRWSNENPRLLVEIVSDNAVRLRVDQKGDYVALSYCWGDLQLMSPDEVAEVQRGKTLTTNLDRRLEPFDMDELPTTVRDALRFIHAMGVQYAWIDTLCIVQDKPEGVATMHKVYSNALFTLCACATTRATAKLLDRREAWTQRTEPCRLGGCWLTTPDMSLNELRLRSPLAERAWTLQEERLSPRMLYLSSSRVYWSCAKSNEMELKPVYGSRPAQIQRPVFAVDDRNDDMPIAQEFLLASFEGDEIHTFWSDIVKSYALRSMSNLTDRLTALSGMAARYLDASRGDEYLAGIWANDLPEGLAWRVDKAVEVPVYELDSPVWPSWSWAVLPLQTAIETEARLSRVDTFARIVDGESNPVSGRRATDDDIKRGQSVKQLRVTGRIRKLWEPTSELVPWGTVSRMVDTVEKFTFAANREQAMHAVHPESGRVLVYEDRKREIIGQLDFQREVRRAQTDDVDLWALEIGSSIMLLLEPANNSSWRRVGVAWDVREDYFVSAQPRELILQ